MRVDFEAAGPADKGGLHAIVYARAIGSGHEPYGAILANFEFGPDPEGMALLQRCAAVALLAQAPFVAAASPRLLGIESYRALGATDGGQEPDVLRRLREEDGARALGLVLPRFLLRAPFGRGERREVSFANEESTEDHESYCWGNAIFAFATRLTDSFARYRWCPNTIGPGGGGLLAGLPQPEREGKIESPTEVGLSLPPPGGRDRGARADPARDGRSRTSVLLLSELPGCAPILRRHGGRQGRQMNYMLGPRLPYFFIVARLVHYLKVIDRSYQHAFETPKEAEKELNDWLAQYVAVRDVVTAASRPRRPLRKVKVRILNTEHESDWYRLETQLRPHFKHMGAFFTLGAHNRIEKR